MVIRPSTLITEGRMDEKQLSRKLDELIASWETEVIEFKAPGKKFDTDRIGQYFSALSNEANLSGLEEAWLVLGVRDSDRKVVGTAYREDHDRLQGLKLEISSNTDMRMGFRGLHVLQHERGRVVMMQIPAAPQGIPIGWKGRFCGREGESLTTLSLDKLDRIRAQSSATDWSGHLVSDASLDDLDDRAVEVARESFARQKADHITEKEIMKWSKETLLDKIKVTQDGQVTRTALLLLGKPESSFRLLPHPAQLTWRLEAEEQAYEHFGIPFLLSSIKLFERIRNVQIRILPQDQMFTVEVAKYDQRVVMEALHNCIAHQDYTRNSRIVVTEYPDRLVFENKGGFFEGLPDDYMAGDRTPSQYRNTFLAQAMARLGMIDQIGYGIKLIHSRQADRFFPMPDYDLKEQGEVKLTIHGRIVDEAYSRLLMQKTDLPLDIVIALDRVQKKLSRTLTEEMIKRLRQEKLIEGRKPNFFVSASVAEATSRKAEYIRKRPQDDEYYAKLITDYLGKFDKASRKELDELLISKMSEALNHEQKKTKVTNLLAKLRRSGVIENKGSKKAPEWALVEEIAE